MIMNFPNFLIIGSSKAGTTSLSQYLSEHPQIYICPTKEVSFFSFYNNAPKFKGPGDERINNRIITNLNEYLKLFYEAHVSHSFKAIGEASVWYLYNKSTARNIFNINPDMKLIAVLRNPIERAYSSYLMNTREGRETANTFINALREEEYRIEDNWEYIWHYVNAGYYYEQLLQYFYIFNKKNIKIFLYEDFKTNPMYVISQLFSFLNVDTDFKPNISYKLNVSGIPRSQSINKILNHPNALKNVSNALLPKRTRAYMRTVLNSFNLSRPPIPNSTREQLSKTFREDISKLQTLLSRDLSHWLT